jgi:DNA-binding HxlR family transcriptional regulator
VWRGWRKRFLWEMNEMSRRETSQAARPIFIGKWTTEILFSLRERPHRHGQLQRRLRSISQRMLTRTLRHLESSRLIARSVSGPDASAVEYSLTQMGRTFIVPLTSMCRWARQRRTEITAELRLVELEKESL